MLWLFGVAQWTDCVPLWNAECTSRVCARIVTSQELDKWSTTLQGLLARNLVIGRIIRQVLLTTIEANYCLWTQLSAAVITFKDIRRRFTHSFCRNVTWLSLFLGVSNTVHFFNSGTEVRNTDIMTHLKRFSLWPPSLRWASACQDLVVWRPDFPCGCMCNPVLASGRLTSWYEHRLVWHPEVTHFTGNFVSTSIQQASRSSMSVLKRPIWWHKLG